MRSLLGFSRLSILFTSFSFFTALTSIPISLAQETAYPVFNAFALPKTLSLCGEPMPLENRRVWEMLDREFTLSVFKRAQVILWLKRSGRYFPYIEKKLDEARMPKDLKYLAVAESSLLPGIRSKKGALGLWQFITPTARSNGLRKDRKTDERLQFERSTEAALNYLQTLKGVFGTWTLALAAYNCGEKRLDREIEDQQVKDYYRLNLPQETERFIFRIAAIKIIMEDPERYGYKLAPQSIYRPIKYDIVPVKISKERHLTDVAKTLGTEFKVIKELNPHIFGYYLPAGRYTIKVPYGLGTGEIKDVVRSETSVIQVSHTSDHKEENQTIITDNIEPKESRNISNPPQEKGKDLSRLVMANEAQWNSVSESEVKPFSALKEREKIKLLVESWRTAWEGKRLDEYIAHYHPAFENDGKDLDTWKNYKDKLNKRYRNISIKIANLEVNVEDSKAMAYFRQRYRSDSYQDDEYKLIEFRKKGHSWKIFREWSFAKEPDKWPKYAEYIENMNREPRR